MSSDLPRNLTDVEVATYLCVSVSVVRKWRLSNGTVGPPYVKLGGCIRYSRADLEAWETAQRM